MEKPLIAIFSDANFLAIYLVENFLAKICKVIVFTKDRNGWMSKISHIPNKTNLEIADEGDIEKFPNLNYSLFLSGFIKKENIYSNFLETLRNQNFKNTKTLAIFPIDLFDQKESARIPINSNLAVIYTGDLVGPRMDLNSHLLFSTLLNESIQKRMITLGIGETFYPLFVSDLAKAIVKWVFSFGPYGKETFVLGNQISGTTLWSEFKKSIVGLGVIYDKEIPVRVVPKGYEVKTIETNLNNVLKETFSWVVSKQTFVPISKTTQTPRSKKIESNKVQFKLPKFKVSPQMLKYKLPVFIALFILLFPYLCLGGVGGLFYLSYRNFSKGKSDSARNLLLLSKTPALIGKEESRILKYIPVLNLIYRESYYMLDVAQKLADIGVNSIYLADSSKELFDKVLGNEIYDPENISKEISLNLDYINKGISGVQADTQNAALDKTLSAKKVLTKVDFEKVKRLLTGGVNITGNLSSILGKEKRQTYLVLFQNNMELRPTGGFIGSFGLLTFEGGRMTDLSVSDVYSADGQLNGHIEPPAPIRDYLDEASWFLRDSNWDPDFPTSAKRAEWFLNKEIDKEVDGVMAVDLNLVKRILRYTGPIYLSDYNMDITEENLYLKTQEEVHQDFFPGTHKKASFLTALSRNLVTEITKLSSGNKIKVLKEIYNNLEERHVQVYLHNEDVQNSVSALSWSGEVFTPTCPGNCYTDFYGVVEANVGVNKANYFVQRSQHLETKLSGNAVSNTLTLEIKNTANPSLGLAGKYKAYVRILVPENSQEGDIFEVVGQSARNVNPEIYPTKGRKELGFLVEVVGGESKKVIVNWETPIALDFSKPGEYRLYVRKQAGTTEEDTTSFNITLPILKINMAPKLTLTKDGSFSYNTTLARDFFSRISW